MAWPAQMVVEPGDEISGLPEEGNGQPAPTGTRTGPASSLENQEGRGQQGFEGPEKTLEIEFEPDVGHEEGLRAIRREQWDAILEQAQCHILHQRGNDHFDSYVLSESSLFVYKSKLVLKTCGTTTLLRCLPLLTVVSKNYGLNLEWIGYSRKNFTFPTDQTYPHTSFAEEVDFLQGMFSGSAYVHGPLNSDHWYTYVADDCKKSTNAAADRTLNMMMYDLEPEVAQNFYKTDKIQTGEDVSSRSGIKSVLPNAALQDHLFEPCGYSMNALEGQAYYTVHVTPEPDFSYASFETNVRLPDYDALVRGVLEVFRPRKFTMTLFGEDSGIEDIKQSPFDYSDIACGPTSASSTSARYERTLKTTTNFSGDYFSQMGNWVREQSAAAAATPT
ncbi:S-Adenosylmethionine decarboxylase [Ectocarpus siliculosus]|uniref:adenosylmethionine decarboxylase n=1 Tax=Ectocarpus siliculosus TaxID=2880 RepID=D7FY29_ECTSI|nr:S-Adenosylmethionine decarboxylase [Ectocarpus siliculosus]|eukprot:CBJ32442.1 S-Adenosylmethionine decarboxylase [Ectocarpus siliculosus]